MKESRDLIEQASIHTSCDYLLSQSEFKRKAAKEEKGMYWPFAQMVKLILQRHQPNTTHGIKALPFTGNDYVKQGRFAERKPDVLLVPEKDGETEITDKTVRWHHVLLPMEFKKASTPSGGKRGSEEAGVTDVEIPSQRRSTTTTREAVAQPANALGTGCVPPPEPDTSTSKRRRKTASAGRTRPSSNRRGRRNAATSSRVSASNQLPSLPFGFAIPGPVQATPQGTMEPPRPPINPTEIEGLNVDHTPVLSFEGNDDDGIVRRTRRPAVDEPSTGGNNMVNWEVQLANYVTEVMSDRSDRTYAFGALIHHTKMQLTYYSRSVYVISNEFDIVLDPELFSLVFLLFAKQPLEKLGFNTEMGYCNPFNTMSEKVMGMELDAVANGGDNFQLRPDTRLNLGHCIHSEYCLSGRATSVYDVKRPQNCEIDLVVKFSWQVKQRRREDIAIRIARSVDPIHSPEIYGVGIAPEKSPSSGMIEGCNVRPHLPPEERELRVLLMRKYKPVEELDNENYFKVAQQFVQCK